jgi:hypothetical protein
MTTRSAVVALVIEAAVGAFAAWGAIQIVRIVRDSL